MFLNQKGEGRGGAIFGFLILGLVIYIAFKVVPVMIRVYAYEDEVREDAKYLHRRNMDQLRDDLFHLAQKEDLPVDEDNIDVLKVENTLKVDIVYSVPIDFPGYVYTWSQHIKYEAPIFE